MASPHRSRSALQNMIDLCSKYCDKFCLEFNTKKSKVMIFGRSFNAQCVPLNLHGCLIEFTNEWKYLGTTLVSGKQFSFTARPDLSSFFRATNTVLNVLSGAHEQVLLTLLYANCVPILTYACSIKNYSASDMSDCNIAVNNALRKVFGFTEWQSIRTLREIFGFKSIYVIFKTAQDDFLESCRRHHNSIISFIASIV